MVKRNHLYHLIENTDGTFGLIDCDFLVPHTYRDIQIFIGDNSALYNSDEGLVLNYKGRMVNQIDNVPSEEILNKLTINNNRQFMGVVSDEYGQQRLLDPLGNQLIPEYYDTIILKMWYIIASAGENKLLYNSKFEKMDMSMAKHWDVFDFSPQIIHRETNELYYISRENQIIDRQERPEFFTCGTIGPSYYYEVQNKGGKIDDNHIVHHQSLNKFNNKFVNEDTTAYTLKIKADSIFNLMDQQQVHEAHLNLDYNDQQIYEFTPRAVFVYYDDEKIGLAKITFTHYSERTIESEKFFEIDKPATFEYIKDEHPIKFSSNGLCGYVGINEMPFAIKLGEMDGGYCRFELPDGRKGYLSLRGDVIYDE